MRLVVVVAIALLITPAAGAVPYLQPQADAGKSGFVSDPGPAWLDLATHALIPGTPGARASVIILGDAVFAATMDAPADELVETAIGSETTTLWRLDLASESVSGLASVPGTVRSGLASDGHAIFLVVEGRLHAFDAATGRSVWPPLSLLPSAGAMAPYCSTISVFDGDVLVACYIWSAAMVMRVNGSTGIPVWDIDAADLLEPAGSAGAFARATLVQRVSAVKLPDQVVVHVDRQPTGSYNFFHGFSWEDGTRLWTQEFYPPTTASNGPLANSLSIPDGMAAFDDILYITQFRDVLRVDPEQVLLDWRIRPHASDLDPFIPFPLAATRSFVVAALEDTLYRIAPDGHVVWPRGVDESQPILGVGTAGLLAGPDRIWAATANDVLILSASDGRAVDSATASSNLAAIAVGEGRLVALGGPVAGGGRAGESSTDSSLLVYGPSPLTPTARIHLASSFVPPGDELVLDVGRSAPGPSGETLTFVVDWGDGTEDRGSGPEFRHRYSAAANMQVRVKAEDETGRQHSAVAVVHAGQAEPNLISEAFSPENQESTFFILGLIVILVGSAFGAVRLRRKRGRLRRELAAADAIVQQSGDDAEALREGLAEHRRRAQRLFLAGRLDEGSTSILRGHVDELLRDHRLSSVEAELAFLPHGLFRSMQEMLRDARVTELEKTQFIRSLAAERGLTAAQKKRVTRHVETWHREDAATSTTLK